MAESRNACALFRCVAITPFRFYQLLRLAVQREGDQHEIRGYVETA